jgi:lysophospholipase L1-like esterase
MEAACFQHNWRLAKLPSEVLMKELAIAVALCMALAAQPARPPVRIILVGDSTMAPNNGYGPGLCALMQAEVTCLNLAKNGRSSSSYRAEGSWDQVMALLKDGGKFRATWVLLQFGHNDQPGKPGRSTELETEFGPNLKRYVEEVKNAGGRPVLVTSLTRRSFKNNQLQDTLKPWAEATKRVSAAEGLPVLDLHTDSMAAVRKMGPAEANTLAVVAPPPEIAASAASGTTAPAPRPDPANPEAPVFDYTHLGRKGQRFSAGSWRRNWRLRFPSGESTCGCLKKLTAPSWVLGACTQRVAVGGDSPLGCCLLI